MQFRTIHSDDESEPNHPRSGQKSAADDRSSSDASYLLSVNDFRRLGLQYNETRRTIIRRAADRTSRGLARRQLHRQDPGASSELSLVLAATYRLLDPRQRGNVKDRVFLGRIMPNALRWAGKTSFSGGQNQTGAGGNIPELDYGDAVEYEYIGVESLIQTPATGLDLNVPWQNTLDSADLLRPSTRWLRWIQQQLHRPANIVGLITLLLLATFWVSRKISQQPSVTEALVERTIVPKIPTSVPTLPSIVDDVKTDDLPPDQSPDTNVVPAEVTSPPVEPALPKVIDDAPAAKPDQGDVVNPDTDIEPKPIATPPTTTPPTTTPPAANPPQLSLAVDPIPDAWNRNHIVELDDQLFPLSVEFSPGLIPLELEYDSPQIASNDTAANPAAVPETHVAKNPPKFARPETAEVNVAKQHLSTILPGLTHAMTRAKVSELQQQLDEISNVVEPGSAEHWAYHTEGLKLSWLVKSRVDLLTSARPLDVTYDIEQDLLLAESYAEACKLPLQNQDAALINAHLVEQGILLVDATIISQHWDAAQKSIRALESVAERSTPPKPVTDAIANLSVGLRTAKRLSASANEIQLKKIVDTSPSDAGSMGRLYCLMLRDWDKGLPWLAAGSDSRLALLAKTEQELNAADDDSVLQLAKRWLQAADRNKGRAGESIRLHAIELMQQQVTTERGIAQLAIQQTLEETRAGVSDYLVKLILDRPSSQDQPQNTQPDPPDPVLDQPVDMDEKAAAQVQRGTIDGRLRLNGADIGYAMEYRLGEVITEIAAQQLRERTDQEIVDWSLELAGTFTVEKQSVVAISLPKNTKMKLSEVVLDDRRMNFSDDNRMIITPLSAGQHTLRWQHTAKDLTGVSLSIKSVSDKKDVPVNPAYESKESDLPTVATIKMTPASP